MPRKKIADAAVEVKETVRTAGRKAKAKAEEAVEKVEEAAVAAEVEVKKTTRAAGRRAKAKVEEAAAQTAEKASDAIAAAEVEVKKTTRAAGRKAKAKVEEAAGKAAEQAADVAVAAEIEAGKAKAKRTRKAAEAKEAVVEEAKKPGRKARAAKLEIVVQSAMGGAITTEQIAAKVPKDAISAYVKVEENKIYWVGKDGETGAVDIWA